MALDPAGEGVPSDETRRLLASGNVEVFSRAGGRLGSVYTFEVDADRDHVSRDAKVFADEHASYSDIVGLNRMGCVNHCQAYSSEDGTNTNLVESLFSRIHMLPRPVPLIALNTRLALIERQTGPGETAPEERPKEAFSPSAVVFHEVVNTITGEGKKVEKELKELLGKPLAAALPKDPGTPGALTLPSGSFQGVVPAIRPHLAPP